MHTHALSRRDLLKAGAHVVGLPADQLDSWLAIAPDGTVSVFTSKVDLGTGIGTALGQIVAEELDVPISRISMEIGDTTKSVDQGLSLIHISEPTRLLSISYAVF